MAKSFVETKEGANSFLVAYVYENDPMVESYKKIDLSGMSCVDIVYGKDRCMVEVLNYLSTDLLFDADFYSEVNDDHVFITQGWDMKMIDAITRKNNGFAIAYGKTENLPTATMCSGSVVRGLGYFFPPEYKHSWVDNWLVSIGFETNILTYLPDVIVEHRHHAFGLSAKDSVYNYAEQDYSNGKEVFERWLASKKEKDCFLIESLKASQAPIKITGDYLMFKKLFGKKLEEYGVSFGDVSGIGLARVGKELLAKYRIPVDYGPIHPDWKIPSKQSRYRAMLEEAGL
jgi:hypothetical protein